MKESKKKVCVTVVNKVVELCNHYSENIREYLDGNRKRVYEKKSSLGFEFGDIFAYLWLGELKDI